MADNSGGGGASSVLALLLGGLIVAVVVLGFFMFTGGHIGSGAPSTPSHITMNVKPSLPSHP